MARPLVEGIVRGYADNGTQRDSIISCHDIIFLES